MAPWLEIGSRRTATALVKLITEHAGVTDPRILEAFLSVPREAFVPAELLNRAFEDTALPIGQGQTISQPSMLAIMLDELDCRWQHRVLEVGSGSGYAAALLSRLAREVHGVERQPELLGRARGTLERIGVRSVTLHESDGSLGLPAHAPYDRILVSAGAASIPEALLAQVAEGGRLVMPVGSPEAQSLVTCERDEKGSLHYRAGTPCIFVPLVCGESSVP